MKRILKKDKNSVLVENLHLDSIEEAKIKKQIDQLKKFTKNDSRKTINQARRVDEFF